MIDAESYGVSGRQLLSSKQVPASGRVCSWRKPERVAELVAEDVARRPEPEFCSEYALTSTLRCAVGAAREERAGEVLRGAASARPRTARCCCCVVQLPSCDEHVDEVDRRRRRSPTAPAPWFIALTMAGVVGAEAPC